MAAEPSVIDPALVAEASAAAEQAAARAGDDGVSTATAVAPPRPRDDDAVGLRDRVIVITGGARGLGAATASVLGAAGARIVVADVHFEQAHDRAQTLAAQGIDAIAVPCDVGDEAQVQALVARVVEHHGRLDVAINNAAIDLTAPVAEMSAADWERELRINLTGPFLLVKHALPHLRRGGHVVNIASTAAKRAWPNAAAYHASKWGLLGFSHALHAELRPHGIKVTAIVAGGMRTPFLLDRFPDIDVGTLQDPHEVAQTIRFVLTQPAATVIPEVMVLPMAETSWP